MNLEEQIEQGRDSPDTGHGHLQDVFVDEFTRLLNPAAALFALATTVVEVGDVSPVKFTQNATVKVREYALQRKRNSLRKRRMAHVIRYNLVHLHAIAEQYDEPCVFVCPHGCLVKPTQSQRRGELFYAVACVGNPAEHVAICKKRIGVFHQNKPRIRIVLREVRKHMI